MDFIKPCDIWLGMAGWQGGYRAMDGILSIAESHLLSTGGQGDIMSCVSRNGPPEALLGKKCRDRGRGLETGDAPSASDEANDKAGHFGTG